MKRFDFPFSARDSYAALPWILAFMVFLTLLCASVTLNIRTATQHWHAQYDHQLTIQLPAAVQKDPAAAASLMEALRKAPQLEAVEPMRKELIANLLKPWLGEGLGIESLPIPIMAEVRLAKDAGSQDGFRQWLAEHHPDIRVDDHAVWLNDFNRLVRSAGWLALCVVGLIAGVTLVILVMSTRTELALHRATLELLRALGAEDFYIANQFQAKALWMSLQGTLFGLIAAVATMLLFEHIASRIEAPFLPLMQFTWLHVWLFLAVSVLAVGLTVLAARVTTYRELDPRRFTIGG